ncbi:hypothetical protein AGDE_00471 [Angomonas deanei]|uniref:Uncharacterized protein n=1 Tax=Angomonas deanei TaxID=59799 RepID=S9WNQ4_9TRYP|nr:hypothetical protein AGDE_03030 [Angomonas deanei]EPY43450.1 hypothetical protein AGDE_00471 [Angomonas deanei]CAD2222983.1 hypothetical protein, conserved [Angomonas deanei]|eukprot:EPY40896.1 hypothetical protein AGDE_03030 [Angomonas deanei]
MYRPTGLDRDSYISGVRPTGAYGAPHDVDARRDNLPDNVFNYVASGVQREDRLREIEQDRRARIRLDIETGKGGKRMANSGGSHVAQTSEQLAAIADTQDRHAALLDLYQQEAAAWDDLLAQRGLATKR